MPDFPKLTFLPVGNLLIHERHDESRARPLIKRMFASGLFRNPPIVSPLRDGSERYMVLDGANRTTALQEMGFPHALVQVLEPDDPGIGLQNWNHVVWELNPKHFLYGIRDIPGLSLLLQKKREGRADLNFSLAMVQSCKGRVYALCTGTHEQEKRVELLNAVVGSYKDRARLDRSSTCDVHPLVDIYPSLCGLVIFPNFNTQDLLQLAGKGYLLPAGITRFTISPRALHLNYPLDELAANKPLEVKNAALKRWVQDRIAHRGVRYYAEATYLFDE